MVGWGRPSPPAPLPVGEGGGTGFYPHLRHSRLPPSFPRRRESTHPWPPGTGFTSMDRMDRIFGYGGGPHPNPSPTGRGAIGPPPRLLPKILSILSIHVGFSSPLPPGEGPGVRAVLRQAQDERGGGGRGGFWVKRAIAVWCSEGSGWFTFAATVG